MEISEFRSNSFGISINLFAQFIPLSSAIFEKEMKLFSIEKELINTVYKLNIK